MSSDTDVNKSASLPADEPPAPTDGPLPGSASDQEKKVRLSPAKMSTKNSTDLVEYVDRASPFLPVIPNNQTSPLEDKLNNQERTIAFLLEQAFRIKEDISTCLQGAQGFRKEESLARKLLESHIQTITSIVKKLNQNIEILEDQIRIRDQAATGTNFVVQDLSIKHLQGVGDLRGRVARCDSSIVKLSGDIQSIRHECRQVEKSIQELFSALETVSKNLDVKVKISLHGHLQTFTGAGTDERVPAVGNAALRKDRGIYLRAHLKLKDGPGRLSARNEPLGIQEKHETKIEEKMLQLSSTLENYINSQKQEAEASKIKLVENKLSRKMNQMEKRIWGELEKMQSDYQSGFKSIHDSLSSLQQIQKTKMDLEKYKVQKDLKKLQRKIVELQEV
ncbi:protein FAM81B isoform X2 [Mesocricetus auratus]|uniref:Protein FAM81B isoform X2 n=1 Tax=Mesocricetus auratus TaxID=10036 RepID=A0ABM2W9S1_MESAU|nr:protein FAM81B isoform X2 [Mesocricetus auratus]